MGFRISRFGSLTSMVYDNAGRLTSKHYADNTWVTFAYDSVSNQTTMIDWSGYTTFTFDSLNRTTGKTDPGSLSQAYTYDLASQRTQLTDPDGGTRNYSYDRDGRMTTITLSSGSVSGYGFDAAARLVSMTQSSPALTANWGYDNANQILTVQRNTGGAGAYYQTLTYDGVGNRVSVRLLDGTQTSYSYDAKNRLTQDATIGLNTHTYNYSFDANDNILTNSESGTLATNTYDIANRLTTSLAGTAMTSYTFDVNGNNIGVSSTGLTTMGYDKENRLVTYLAAGTSVSYVYAGSGLKRTEWNAGTPTTLIWDGLEYLQERL